MREINKQTSGGNSLHNARGTSLWSQGVNLFQKEDKRREEPRDQHFIITFPRASKQNKRNARGRTQRKGRGTASSHRLTLE